MAGSSSISKREALESLTRRELIDLAYQHDLEAPTTLAKPDLVEALGRKLHRDRTERGHR